MEARPGAKTGGARSVLRLAVFGGFILSLAVSLTVAGVFKPEFR